MVWSVTEYILCLILKYEIEIAGKGWIKSNILDDHKPGSVERKDSSKDRRKRWDIRHSSTCILLGTEDGHWAISHFELF